jgi:hypothetical protein
MSRLARDLVIFGTVEISDSRFEVEAPVNARILRCSASHGSRLRGDSKDVH